MGKHRVRARNESSRKNSRNDYLSIFRWLLGWASSSHSTPEPPHRGHPGRGSSGLHRRRVRLGEAGHHLPPTLLRPRRALQFDQAGRRGRWRRKWRFFLSVCFLQNSFFSLLGRNRMFKMFPNLVFFPNHFGVFPVMAQLGFLPYNLVPMTGFEINSFLVLT